MISIHAPREGRDEAAHAMRLIGILFQSTRPARGATNTVPYGAWLGGISIHAPREGRDNDTGCNRVSNCISIHAPREGRDV